MKGSTELDELRDLANGATASLARIEEREKAADRHQHPQGGLQQGATASTSR